MKRAPSTAMIPAFMRSHGSSCPNDCWPRIHVDIDPEYVIAEYRSSIRNYSRDRSVLRGDHRGSFVARRDNRSGAARRAGRAGVRVSVELSLAARRAAVTARCTRMDIPLVFDNIAQPGSLTGAGADGSEDGRLHEQRASLRSRALAILITQGCRNGGLTQLVRSRHDAVRCGAEARARSARRRAALVRAGSVHSARDVLKKRLVTGDW